MFTISHFSISLLPGASLLTLSTLLTVPLTTSSLPVSWQRSRRTFRCDITTDHFVPELIPPSRVSFSSFLTPHISQKAWVHVRHCSGPNIAPLGDKTTFAFWCTWDKRLQLGWWKSRCTFYLFSLRFVLAISTNAYPSPIWNEFYESFWPDECVFGLTSYPNTEWTEWAKNSLTDMLFTTLYNSISTGFYATAHKWYWILACTNTWPVPAHL